MLESSLPGILECPGLEGKKMPNENRERNYPNPEGEPSPEPFLAEVADGECEADLYRKVRDRKEVVELTERKTEVEKVRYRIQQRHR